MPKNELQNYFKELSKIPVLETKKTNELAILAKEDKSARDKLVCGNLRYVIVVAKGFYGQGLPMADLISEGNLGLIKAVYKFKPKKDENFMKCAGWWIRHGIMLAISNNKTVRKPMNKIQEYKENHGVYERERLTALDAPLDRESTGGSTIGDIIAADIDNRAEDMEEIAIILKEATKNLDEKSRNIVFRKYGVGNGFPTTSYSISKEYNISVASVDIILRDAISKMRSNLKKLNMQYEK